MRKLNSRAIELENAQREKTENEGKLKEVIASQTEINEQIEEKGQGIKELEEKIEKDKGEIIELLNAKALIKTKIQRCDTLLEQINIRKSQLNQKLIEFKSQRDGQDNVIKELEQQLENVKSDIKKINDTLNKYNNDLADLRVETADFQRNCRKTMKSIIN
ncbi:MAG: hypothetical protein V8R90_11280 [Eubacterium sp.]